MTFTETRLKGAWLVDADVIHDERGYFARAWMREELDARGLSTDLAQCSLSFNARRNTIRGMHFQTPPFAEVKLVRAIRGSVYDVVIDLRPDSPTFCEWVGVELSAANKRLLYIPAGFAHGYQTMADEAEVFYMVSAPYAPAHQGGVRWNDPAFGIEWPLGAPAVIHARDAAYGDFAGRPPQPGA